MTNISDPTGVPTTSTYRAPVTRDGLIVQQSDNVARYVFGCEGCLTSAGIEGCPTHALGFHKDVVVNDYRTMTQHRVKTLAPDEPDEGGRPGTVMSGYKFTTDVHGVEFCPFEDGDLLRIVKVPRS